MITGDKKEETIVRNTSKRIKKAEKMLSNSNRRIHMSQNPIDLLNHNFRHARFIRNLKKANKDKEQSDGTCCGNPKA